MGANAINFQVVEKSLTKGEESRSIDVHAGFIITVSRDTVYQGNNLIKRQITPEMKIGAFN